MLVNTNNVYNDNNTSPRKQHFCSSLNLLGDELKNGGGRSIRWVENTVLSASSEENWDLHLKTFRSSSFVSSVCPWKSRWKWDRLAVKTQHYRKGAQPAFVSGLLKRAMQMSQQECQKTNSQQSLRFSNFLTNPSTDLLLSQEGKFTLVKDWYCFL